MGNCFEPNSAGYEERLDPVAQRKKTDAPTPDDLVQDKPNDQLASSGDGGISGGEKDRSRGGGVEARNAMFENSSELEPTEPTSPLPVDDESHDHLPDDRTPEETPVITDILQEETPEIEIPREETPVATVEEETPEVEIPHAETPVVTVQEESPEIEIPHEETPVVTDTPQKETPEIEIPQEETPEFKIPCEETPVVTDTLQKETPEIEIPQEETPEFKIPCEETPIVTDTLQKETPEIEIPQEETPEVEQSEEVTPVIETSEEEDSKLSSPNKDVPVIKGHQEEVPVIDQEQAVNEDVPVINGHQEEVPVIDQEQAVNEDVPEISDHMYEYQNGSGNVDNAKSIAHEETPLISSTNGESNNDDTNTEDGIFENENGGAPTIKVNESQSEQTSEQNGHLNVTEGETKVVQVANGDDVAVNESQDSVLTNGVEETHSEEAGADTEEALHENGVPYLTTEEEEERVEDGERGKWRFPPILEDFDLMETEADPDELESMFHDDRLIEIHLDIKEDGPGLGISIVGGNGSPSGDLPIIIKRVLPGCLAEQDGRLKPGDELVAVNEKLLVGVSKVYAINALSNNDGLVRLLVLQDY